MPIYKNHENGTITNQTHYELLERRGLKYIIIKRTKTFEDIQGLEMAVLAEHVWTSTDKLHLLSNKFYGTTKYWWAIGLVNGKPTDGHFKVGDIVYIPESPIVIEEKIR